MDGQTVSGIITSVVAGLITNGIQGFYNYITITGLYYKCNRDNAGLL